MGNRPKPRSLADIKKKTSRNRRSVRVCLDGALYGEHQQLERELDDLLTAESGTAAKMSDNPPSIAKAREVQAVEQKMRDAEEDFVFEALPPLEWRDLIEKHPAGEGSALRWEAKTFWPAAVAACCVEPTGVDDTDEFREWWDGLSAATQALLAEGAVEVNEIQLSVPFSVSASARLRTSVPSSTTARPEESLALDS